MIVLDRDGVINRDSKEFIKSPEEWIPLPGSLEAIAELSRMGFRIAVATNQSGVGRGLFDQDTLDRIHARMIGSVEAAGGVISGVFVCPHHPDDGCDCRKPLPGLLRQIAARYAVSPKEMIVVGDSLRDLEAAVAVGAQPVLVRTGNGIATEKQAQQIDNIRIHNDLHDFTDSLTGQIGKPA